MGMGRLLSQASKLPSKELGVEALCELGSQGGSDHQRWALAGQSPGWPRPLCGGMQPTSSPHA